MAQDEGGEEVGEGVGVFADPGARRQDLGERDALADQGGGDVEEAAADVDDLVAVGAEVAEREGGGEVLGVTWPSKRAASSSGVSRIGSSSVGPPTPIRSATSRPWSRASASSAMPVRVWPRSRRAAIVRSRAR